MKGSPNLHAFFGWLHVETKKSFEGREDREAFSRAHLWAKDHPHIAYDYYDKVPNSIYIAPEPNSKTDRLVIGSRKTNLPAAGMFQRFVPEIHSLTCSGPCPVDGRERDRRSHWSLPRWFYHRGRPTLGMNDKKERWKPIDDKHVHLVSVAEGQEFVFDTNDYKSDATAVADWIEGIIKAGQPLAASANKS